jgi:A/G-specific adenine glycosylase
VPAELAVTEVGIVIQRAGRVLLVQRPAHGRWANLWEFPHTVVDSREDLGRRAARFCRGELSIKIDPGRELITVRHSVTHHRITLICIEACYRSGRFKSESYRHGRWLPLKRLADYPLSAPQRRLARYLIRPARQKSLF